MSSSIDENPNTQLLNTFFIHSDLSVQLLELNTAYFLLEKIKGLKGELHRLDSPLLIQKIQSGHYTKEDILDELPPALVRPDLKSGLDITVGDNTKADPLVHKLSQAMAEFAQNNPQVEIPQAHAPFDLSSYIEQDRGKRSVPELPSEPAPSPIQDTSSEPLLFAKTFPVVESALQEATEQQQKHLKKAQAFQEKIETKLHQWQGIVDQKETLTQTFELLQNSLEGFENDINQGRFQESHLLSQALSDLEDLQENLANVLVDSSAAQAFFQTHHEHQALQTEVLTDLSQTIQKVTQYRRMVQYMIQKLHYQTLTEKRKHHLLERKKELEPLIEHLKESVQQLESVNQDILMLDPLAVPEPPPALVLHELKRLEFEMELILADPAIKESL